MKFRKIIGEFANTFTEIHYLVGGFCVGFVVGWICGCVFTASMI